MPSLRESRKLHALRMKAGVSNSLEYLANAYSNLHESVGEAVTHRVMLRGIEVSYNLILRFLKIRLSIF